ncbi:MAG: starch-binding protein [Muribaculaceae bacterium]|nr:starch-binding protein [Muribaculaceae bacterium]
MFSFKKCIASAATAAALAAPLTAAGQNAFVGDRTDFRDETIYFAMTTRFYDGDPTNNVCGWDRQNVQIANNDPDWRGDFKGLIDRLDYIKALGFTAIWITPVVQNASGTDFHGYHAMDFSKVDLRYESRKSWGAQEDVKFQDLIDAAHAKGMKVILDIVLNHTGNFGEDNFCHLFDRSQNIRNQASVEASLIPDEEKLGGKAYWKLDPNTQQYPTRFKYIKNTDGQNHDSHNYWHHLATAWNWDFPSRWWGQIAGDCVDLNTENPAVAEYLVKCYGKFIEMGVDGFRIDTTGHISRLTFNTMFIPQFLELGEKYKSKRLNQAPFFMFGECCARFSEVTYRNQPNLSSYFYTWKSPQDLVDRWNHDASYWDTVEILEGNDNQYGNQLLCLEEPSVTRESNNVFLKNGAWHEPDYTDYSGFSIIDFPMHYNFNNASAAVGVAKSGDKYYNDASYNVVYVDSHDYCPGPNDGTRFNGGTQQWAENLSLMFTFRGIPCIYYGTEVEFQAGKKVDAGGTDMPVKESGRAYFGTYLEGDVTADDFGSYAASGNVAKTLGADLAQHIIRLNQIRAAVPALRKGQYTFDGCTAKGGHAFKRAWKDSYALVALNGGATFTGVPAGTYTDLVTGKTYQGGGTITVDAPSNKGQVRVLVKDWNGGKVGKDGKFIYETSSVAHGGSVSFTDPGTTSYYTAADAVSDAEVTFSPAGGAFRTETLSVTARLNESAVAGWYQVAGKERVNLVAGNSSTFTIGADMAYGQSVSVNWGATDENGESFTGTLSYKKVDPNATITVYVTSPSKPTIYAWGVNGSGADVQPCGAWPGKTLSETVTVDGRDFYYYTFDDMESVNVIFNNGGQQTGDITGITSDTYFEYDGASSAKKIDVNVTPLPVVKLSPNGGNFSDVLTVTATVSNAESAWYRIGNGAQVAINGRETTFTIGGDMAVGQSVTVTWSATGNGETKTGQAVYTKTETPVEPEGITVYYDNSVTSWSRVLIHHWPVDETSWPGNEMSEVAPFIYKYVVPLGTTGVVFNNGSGDQTNDITNLIDGHLYKGLGNRNWSDEGVYVGHSVAVEIVGEDNTPVEIYNLQGVRVDNPTPGIYIVRKGSKTNKIRIR